MEISARNSSTKIIAIFILSLTTLVFILAFAVAWLAVTNRALIHEQRTVVTPMTYNAPFAVSETKSDTENYRMMTLSFPPCVLMSRPKPSIRTTPFCSRLWSRRPGKSLSLSLKKKRRKSKPVK